MSNAVANKLSLNSLQDRLACASQLSLKRVIATNIVVNFGAKSGKFRLTPRFWQEIAFSSSSLVRYSTAILAFFCCGSIRRRLMATTHNLGARMRQPSHQFDRAGLQLSLQVSSLN
jgi:hypothetical protein